MRENLTTKEEHILAKKPLANTAQIEIIVMRVKRVEVKLDGYTYSSFFTVFKGYGKVKAWTKEAFKWIQRHHASQDKVNILYS